MSRESRMATKWKHEEENSIFLLRVLPSCDFVGECCCGLRKTFSKDTADFHPSPFTAGTHL